MSNCDCELEAKNGQERKTLLILLGINSAMFAVEGLSGWVAESSALLADALDMLADASVYGIGLYAVGRSRRYKAYAAGLSGISQILLAILILSEAYRRLRFGHDPEGFWMMGVGALAVAANYACFRLIAVHKDGDVNMRASYIFSRNDVLANLAVIASGLLTAWTESPYPDLAVSVAICILILKSAREILRDAWSGKDG